MDVLNQADEILEESQETMQVPTVTSRLLIWGISMVFLAAGLPLADMYVGIRAQQPIPISVYSRNVWIKTFSGKTQRCVPFYAAVKIRQRFGGTISLTRPRWYWWFYIKRIIRPH